MQSVGWVAKHLPVKGMQLDYMALLGRSCGRLDCLFHGGCNGLDTIDHRLQTG